MILAKKGIEINSQDKDVLLIKLVSYRSQNIVQRLYYVVFYKNNSIQLFGMVNTGIELVKDTDAFRQIANRNLGLCDELWKAMNNLAHQFGSDIEYSGGEDKKMIPET